MASLRVSALIGLLALFACLGSGHASGYQSQEQYCSKCADTCGLDYDPPEPEYPQPDPEYPDPEPPRVDSSCEKHASYCDFKFSGVKVPTFDLIVRGDNAYDPVILDKYGRVVKVLNANGRCTVFGSGLDCRENFYFKNRRVATRTFNRIPVQEFKGKCIRLEVSSAQLADNSNLNPADGNFAYPEARRCVVFSTY